MIARILLVPGKRAVIGRAYSYNFQTCTF